MVVDKVHVDISKAISEEVDVSAGLLIYLVMDTIVHPGPLSL